MNQVSEVVVRGQAAKVKILSFTGQKISLSIKDVDQETGEDLNPAVSKGSLRDDGYVFRIQTTFKFNRD